MSRRAWKAAVLTAALAGAALTATLVPAGDGGWLPVSIIGMAASGALLRKVTSPRVDRAPGLFVITRLEHRQVVTPDGPVYGLPQLERRRSLPAREIFRRGEEARRRRCLSASPRSDDDASAEKIGAAAGVDHE